MLAAATFEGVAISEAGIIVEANEQFARMLKLKLPEIIGKPVWGFVLPEQQERARNALASGVEVLAEYEGVRRDGRRIYVEVHGRPIKWEGRAARITVVRDITDRKEVHVRLERAVAERTRSLKDLTEQLNAFCYSLAHDLKAPLRAQAMFADLLLSKYGEVLGEKGREYARRIATAASQQGKLVNDLLAHISLGCAELPLQALQLAEAFSLVCADLQVEISEKQALIDSTNLAGCVLANPSSLHLVLTHLLSNALKFVPRGVKPEVQVRAETREAMVRLTVKDNGIGIDPADQHFLFGVFRRLHTGHPYPGTGIGLAIVKRAVERMGGCVGFDSALGKGSRFWVELKATAMPDTAGMGRQLTLPGI